MEVKYCTHIVLGCVKDFLIISGTQECERHTVNAERRLDYIRNVTLFCLIVKVRHVFAGNFLMTTEVIVCTVSDAPKLAPSEREQELDVGRALAVEGKFGLVMITEAKLVFLESEGEQPFLRKCLPESRERPAHSSRRGC